METSRQELHDVIQQNNNYRIVIRGKMKEENTFYQILVSEYRDEKGEIDYFHSWSQRFEGGENSEYFYEEFPLRNYPYDVIFLTPSYSHRWTAKEPVTVHVEK